jgi:hypothetical protein
LFPTWHQTSKSYTEISEEAFRKIRQSLESSQVGGAHVEWASDHSVGATLILEPRAPEEGTDRLELLLHSARKGDISTAKLRNDGKTNLLKLDRKLPYQLPNGEEIANSDSKWDHCVVDLGWRDCIPE